MRSKVEPEKRWRTAILYMGRGGVRADTVSHPSKQAAKKAFDRTCRAGASMFDIRECQLVRPDGRVEVTWRPDKKKGGNNPPF